jgi:hypothetical protein
MPRGRPKGSKTSVAQVPGWHDARTEATHRGVTLERLQVQVKEGIGPRPVKIGQQVLFKDGSLAEYLEDLYRRRNEPRPVRRGRPSAHATA